MTQPTSKTYRRSEETARQAEAIRDSKHNPYWLNCLIAHDGEGSTSVEEAIQLLTRLAALERVAEAADTLLRCAVTYQANQCLEELAALGPPLRTLSALDSEGGDS